MMDNQKEKKTLKNKKLISFKFISSLPPSLPLFLATEAIVEEDET
jgi:hypothetical protein